MQLSLATAGILNSLLVALFLLATKGGNARANILLGILLLSVCFKLSFAFLINFKHQWGFAGPIIRSLSVAAYLSFGPLLTLYYKEFFKQKVKALHKYLMLLPVASPFIGLIFNFTIPLWVSQLYFLFFLVLISNQLRVLHQARPKNSIYHMQKEWIYGLFIGFVLIWMVANVLMFDFDFYFFELLVIFTMVFYVNIYLAIKHYWLKKGKSRGEVKRKTTKLKVKEEKEILFELHQLMEKENLYTNPELTLPKLASILNVKVYKLSYVINHKLDMSFNEYINTYRVKGIIKALSSPENQKTKILSIAFDHGFNSLSVFNQAFKKYTNYSPTEYRNKIILDLEGKFNQ